MKNLRHTLIAQPNITPFVDVVLVLLVIFMLTASLVTYTIPVHLPSGSKSAKQHLDNKPLIITIKKNGKIFLAHDSISIEQLLKTIQGKHNHSIFLGADVSVSYGKVMHVMNKLNQVGFHHVNLVLRSV